MVRFLKILGIAMVTLAILALIAWLSVRWYSRSGPRLTLESAVGTPERRDQPPILVTLKPGVDVQSGIPEGWSDLVIKSVTYLDGGDVDTLPSFAKVTATRFRTIVVADVGRELDSPRYRLRRVGAGLALDIRGVDTTITSDSLKEQGVSLSAIDTLVLGRAERALGRSRLAATTETFALYETFVEVANAEGVHQSQNLYYAMMVDGTSGELTTLCWSSAAEIADRSPPQSFRLLAPGLIFQCGIHVSAHRVIGRFASSWGFAMTGLPPGNVYTMPQILRDKLAGEISQKDAVMIEEELRRAIASNPR